ncbi:MAG TPA: hypothetical protein DDZ68_08805 [Parvularcula sp.]|nr:hypothetical protein [Parvularcula sp.]
MILRRVIEHFKKQEWTAIALDFLIVVIGVFVGLQVNNWNDALRRHAAAETIRERFIENVESDLRILSVRERYFLEAMAYGAAALSVIDGAPPDDDDARWSFVLAAYQAGQIWPFRPSAQIYEELKGAGDLDLIGDVKVRGALANYYDEAGGEIGVTFGAIDPYRALIRRKTPWAIQLHIWDNCHPNEEVDSGRDVPPPEFRYMPACGGPADFALVRAAAEAFAADAELADHLRGRMAELRVTLNFIENHRRDAQEVVDLLRAQRSGAQR